MSLPKGRIPNDTLEYCVMEAGGSLEEYLADSVKIKAVKLGHLTFSAVTNRELLESIFSFVSELPNPNGEG